MKYLRKFANEAEYNAFIASEYEAPNVSLLADSGTVKYSLPLGVFIQHIDGALYTTDEWVANGFANDLANGVAVRTENIAVVMAKNTVGSSSKWLPSDVLVEGCYATTILDEAIRDYNGLSNTEAIIAVTSEGIAYEAAQYVFPNGAKGYLPALGELAEIMRYKTEVSSALYAIGGTALNIGDYAPGNNIWGSTQRTDTYAYYYDNIKGGNFEIKSVSKTSSGHARPFTKL